MTMATRGRIPIFQPRMLTEEPPPLSADGASLTTVDWGEFVVDELFLLLVGREVVVGAVVGAVVAAGVNTGPTEGITVGMICVTTAEVEGAGAAEDGATSVLVALDAM